MLRWTLLVLILLTSVGCKLLPVQAQLAMQEGHTVLRLTFDHDEFPTDSRR